MLGSGSLGVGDLSSGLGGSSKLPFKASLKLLTPVLMHLGMEGLGVDFGAAIVVGLVLETRLANLLVGKAVVWVAAVPLDAWVDRSLGDP